LHEFDDNVEVFATTVASITTGNNVQFQAKITTAEVAGAFGLRAGGVSAAPEPAAAVGVAPAPAGLFQLPSHRQPPQTTVRERCELHKRM